MNFNFSEIFDPFNAKEKSRIFLGTYVCVPNDQIIFFQFSIYEN